MKFIALPVSQGDGFYAETDDGFRVLVDGGRSRRALPELFRRYTRSEGVNVLVCTHNDADHAEGVIGFLESGLDCRELWLPVTWLEALSQLPPSADETLEFLRERFVAIKLDRLPLAEESDLQEEAWQALIAPARDAFEGQPQEMVATQENGDAVFAGVALSHVVDVIDDHLEMLWHILGPWRRPWPLWYGDRRDVLVLTVLKDVRRLLEIARLALDRGIPIRCFRHDPHKAAPVPRYLLVPLSGRPVQYVRPTPPRRPPEEFYYLAWLTTVNRESLVCYLGARDGQPGVLFTADSDLKDIRVDCVQLGSVVTAPHHGSHHNAPAYERFPGGMVWVRSDGYSRSRPCSAYLSAPGQRFCTLCRNSGRPKQAVRLYTRKGRWVRRLTLPCDCQ